MDKHPVMELLAEQAHSLNLLDKLLEQVLANKIDEARATAAKIEAYEEIKFDLMKAIKENEWLP